VWVEGNREISDKMLNSGIPNIINAVVDDQSGKTVTFNITNNGQSSSILELGTHKSQHPHVYVSKTETVVTKSIMDIATEHNLDFTKYNFWNFDIQGAELRALTGAGDLIRYADILYLEVNVEELYKGCALVHEIDAYVEKYGFKRIATSMTVHGWGDAVYAKK
jgi:FkbM family methyltransferase